MTLPTVVVVTGTDTDVGKTVVTAAIAAVLAGSGRRVAVYKPAQTGVAPDEPGDVAEVTRLAGVGGSEGVRLLAPMAPRAAAALEGAALPGLADHVAAVRDLASSHDHVLVEGAGGLLVELTQSGDTVADLARLLPDVGVVLVVRSTLGTLNHTMLTREALSRRGIRSLGIVVGSWPHEPGIVETTNRDVLAGLPEGLLGAVPAGAPLLSAGRFRRAAVGWLPDLLGRSSGLPSS